MKPYLNIQEAIRDFSDRIGRLEAAIESEREKEMRVVAQEATCDVSGCHKEAKCNVRLRIHNVKEPLGDIFLDLCVDHEKTHSFSVSPSDITLERYWF